MVSYKLGMLELRLCVDDENLRTTTITKIFRRRNFFSGNLCVPCLVHKKDVLLCEEAVEEGKEEKNVSPQRIFPIWPSSGAKDVWVRKSRRHAYRRVVG